MHFNYKNKSTCSFILSITALPLLIMLSACGGGSDKVAKISPDNDTVAVSDAAPAVTITSPSSGLEVGAQNSISLSAIAEDAEDGDISSNVQWQSDIDGNLGTGANISVQLSVGTHTITATIADSKDQSAETAISIQVNNLSGMATISWNPPTRNTDNSDLQDLAGFKIYVGESAEALQSVKTIDDPSAYSTLVEELKPNTTYYFAVTAINSHGIESDYSNIATKDVR